MGTTRDEARRMLERRADFEALATSETPELPYQAELARWMWSRHARDRSGLRRYEQALGSALVIDPEPFGASQLARTLATWIFDDPGALTSLNAFIRAPESAIDDLYGHPPLFEDNESPLVRVLREKPRQLIVLDHAEQLPADVLERLADHARKGQVRGANDEEADCTGAIFLVTQSLIPDCWEDLGIPADSDRDTFLAAFEALLRAQHWDRYRTWITSRVNRSLTHHWFARFRAGELPSEPAPLVWRSAALNEPVAPAPGVLVPILTKRPLDPERIHDAFLSYSSKKHKNAAERLHGRLVSRGYDVWFDQEVMARASEGQAYDSQEIAAFLMDAVSRSRCTVVFSRKARRFTLPADMTPRQAIEGLKATPALGHLIAFDWQSVEAEAARFLMEIDLEGSATESYDRTQDTRSLGREPFTDEGEMADQAAAFIDACRGRPYEPIKPYDAYTEEQLSILLDDDVQATMPVCREILSHNGAHRRTRALLMAMHLHPWSESDFSLLADLLELCARPVRDRSRYGLLLESLISNAPRASGAYARGLLLAKASLQEGSTTPDRGVGVFAGNSGVAAEKRPDQLALWHLALEQARRVHDVNGLQKGCELAFPDKFAELFPLIWERGRDFDAKAFEQAVLLRACQNSRRPDHRGVFDLKVLHGFMTSMGFEPEHQVASWQAYVQDGKTLEEAARLARG